MSITYTPNGRVRTPAGIVIGGAFTRPALQTSADAEYVQRVLLEKRHDAETRAIRARHVAACIADRCSQGDKPCPTPGACVIDLDNSLWARVVRALVRLVRGRR
jgi:hypothetical protein